MQSLIAKLQALSTPQQLLAVILFTGVLMLIAARFIDKLGREGSGQTFLWFIVVLGVLGFIYSAFVIAASATKVIPFSTWDKQAKYIRSRRERPILPEKMYLHPGGWNRKGCIGRPKEVRLA